MILNVVPFRSSVEPSFKDLRFAYAAETSASCPPVFEMKRPRDSCDGVTSPIDCCAGSMPPIVYEELLMFVCGGLTTCRNVCSGVVNRARNCCIRAGRHFRAAGELKKPPPPASGTPSAAEALLPARLRAGLRAAADAELREARLHSCGLGCGRRLDLAANVELLAAGPDLRDDLRHDALLVDGRRERGRSRSRRRPESDEIFAVCFCGNVSCVPGRKKSCTNCVPGLAELREVGDRGLGWPGRTWPPPPRPKPPVSCCGDSVTVRSVPIVESGLSAVFWAWSRPRARPLIVITSATPSGEPDEREPIARVRRPTSSLRR